jgi:hypothetical protein
MKSLSLASELARALRVALMFAFILFAMLILRIERANAQQAGGPTIFDVRRSLPLEPDEEVTKDFYINVGPESGLKKGVYVSVVRAVPIHDPIKNMQQATLHIPVGKLKVIDVQRGITVARLESELGDDERPTLEFEGVMVGDQLDLGTITTDAPKRPKAKVKKVAVVAPVEDSPSESQGSAAAMAARSAAPAVAAPAPAAAASQADTRATASSGSSATIDMTTAADVKSESPPASESATNNSTTPANHSEEAPKKSQTPKSAGSDDMNLMKPFEKTFPAKATTDTVRVADY